MDIAYAIEGLVPAAEYEGSVTSNTYDAFVAIVWKDARPKPTWEALNNYWYTDGERRYDRFKFRAQPGKPEKQVAEEAGVRSVWGCGNRIYLLKL